MVFGAGGPLIFNCRYTSLLIVVHQWVINTSKERLIVSPSSAISRMFQILREIFFISWPCFDTIN